PKQWHSPAPDGTRRGGEVQIWTYVLLRTADSSLRWDDRLLKNMWVGHSLTSHSSASVRVSNTGRARCEKDFRCSYKTFGSPCVPTQAERFTCGRSNTSACFTLSIIFFSNLAPLKSASNSTEPLGCAVT